MGPPTPPPHPVIAPPPPGFSPTPGVPVRRTRMLETETCWIPGCTEQCVIDRDLENRVTTILVTKGYTAGRPRIEPLLIFPALFYHICPEHRLEKYGYRDIYGALAYLLAETRSSSAKRLNVTEATLRQVGLDNQDLAEIRRAMPR